MNNTEVTFEKQFVNVKPNSMTEENKKNIISKRNRLVVIGYMGDKKCYLNMSDDQAIAKYCISEKISNEQFWDDENINIETIDFNDAFGAYGVYSCID